MKRYALVSNARTRQEAEAYLPDNYQVIHETTEAKVNRQHRALGKFEGERPVFVIEGEDLHGWTLHDYVIPRYASGLIGVVEVSHPLTAALLVT